MTANEVLAALSNGEKIARQCWAAGEYLYFDNFRVVNQNGVEISWTNSIPKLLNYDDWEIVKDNLTSFEKVPLGEKFSLKDKSGFAYKVKDKDKCITLLHNKGIDYMKIDMADDETVIYPV